MQRRAAAVVPSPDGNPMDLQPGQRIDHYTLIERVGEGGQGAVWKALDPREGGVVRALKLVSLADAGLEGFERAQREARILAGASHPALVTCHGIFEDLRAGLLGLVMDLVPGRSLAAAIADRSLDAEGAEAVIEQIAEALAYIHGAGLVHRDLKPENVILTEGFPEDSRRPGTVKLIDFGIATTAKRKTRVTAAGVVIGTPAYLAPELAQGSYWDRAEGPARDVFAFGVLAYVLRFGGHPSGIRTNASLSEYVRAYQAAPWPPPLAVGTPIAACLALQPEGRPRDGAAVLALIRGQGPAPLSAVAPGAAPERAPDTAEYLATAGLKLPVAPPPEVAEPEAAPPSIVRDEGPPRPRVPVSGPVLPPAPRAARGLGAALPAALVAVAVTAGAYVIFARPAPAPDPAPEPPSADPPASAPAPPEPVSAAPIPRRRGWPPLHLVHPHPPATPLPALSAPEVASCPPPAQRCGATCTSLDHDPDNCGACGTVCRMANARCAEGRCGCTAGFRLDGAACVAEPPAPRSSAPAAAGSAPSLPPPRSVPHA